MKKIVHGKPIKCVTKINYGKSINKINQNNQNNGKINDLNSGLIIDIDNSLQTFEQKYDQDIKICYKCDKENNIQQMVSFCNKGITKYECVDEENCFSKEKLKEIQIKKRNQVHKEKLEKYNHLSQEDQLEKMYNVKFCDLNELGIRLRDASWHYEHYDTEELYSWNYASKYWYQTTLDLTKFL